ncbi:hypothetical protein [Streptomyces sp. NPDC056492]|uniref:hypothetical protein n=1 Tax=unclassified Streptomyces TaxID=2593676 RepID=UPI00368FAE8A
MLTCPDPPAVTVIVDPGDDLVHTRAALAAHDPLAGRITVHPTPGTDSTLALAHDVLAALGKPVPVAGYREHDTAAAWTLAAAWILATGTTHLLLLRVHLMTPQRLEALLLLRRRTGLHLTLVIHTGHLPAGLDRVLSGVRHHLADATALLPAAAAPCTADHPPRRPLAHRWIALPALTTLLAFDEPARLCHCRAPLAADCDFFPPVIPQTTEAEVAWRLHRATAHPHVAAELATAVFTAASTTQLSTVHVHDLGPEASTITLHDDGLRQGCLTHPVPLWARPLLMAARRCWDIVTGTSGPLFTDPLGSTGLPHLTAFAESCKLRPPQPPRPAPRKRKTGTAPRPRQQQETVWPVCTVHYGLASVMLEPDQMRGCPYPPPHTRKTIARRKNGWLPPDYGLRELQPPR